MTSGRDRLAAVRTSTDRLLTHLDGLAWTDDDVAAPSLCAGWTRGHVLTHIARNADGIADTLLGALEGRIVPRYPGGPPARNAAIDAGAARPFAELAADVRQSAERLDRAFAEIDAVDGWTLLTDEGRVAADWPRARWKEVEIHRVDLADRYSPEHWPAELVAELLPAEIDRLPQRTDQPLLIEIATGSSVAGLVGREWRIGSESPRRVSGPDWAVLAWLVGRPVGVGTDVPLRPFN
jgi:maleylpyruvate isomerase